MKVVIRYHPTDGKPDKCGSNYCYLSQQVHGNARSETEANNAWIKFFGTNSDSDRMYKVLVHVGGRRRVATMPGSHLFIAGASAIRAARVMAEAFDLIATPKAKAGL